jgi:hypothetical protein
MMVFVFGFSGFHSDLFASGNPNFASQEEAQSEEAMTPEETKKKLINFVAESLVQKLSDEDVKVEMKLALDLSGEFTITTPFGNLQEEIQEKAHAQGYIEKSYVKIVIDAASFEYHIVPVQPNLPWKADIIRAVSADEQGGSSGVIGVTDFIDLPANVQHKAAGFGYKGEDPVRFFVPDSGDGIEILPKPLFIGAIVPWDTLSKKEKKQAGRLGYNQNDEVWKTFDPKKDLSPPSGDVKMLNLEIDGKNYLGIAPTGWFEIIPPPKNITEPMRMISAIFIDVFSSDDVMIRCLSRMEYLNKNEREAAFAAGYVMGDRIVYFYNTTTKKFEIQPPSKEKE